MAQCTKPMYIRDSWNNEMIPVPCGQCIDCRLNKAGQWAVRSVHEASMYKDNCFITLTYNNENLPKDRCVHKSVITKFIRKVRKYANSNFMPYLHQKYKTIRFYACGEYGSSVHTGRPHYHILLFNHDFEDKYKIRGQNLTYWQNHFKTGNTNDLYRSPQLETLWEKGFSTIGTVTLESAGYVARYIMKKITGEMAETHYKRDLLQPGSKIIKSEFALMSRMPGIGKPWLDKYYNDVYPKDHFHINGIKKRPPRYYDSQLEKIDPGLFAQLKLNRKDAAQKTAENTVIDGKDTGIMDSKRAAQKRNYRELVTKTLKRTLDNG